MSVDDQDGAPLEVTTGLRYGSPISSVLFDIYIAEVHLAAESQVEGSRDISFVDDVTWVVEGANTN